jgi:FAD/FMN-containing dehydrogenase
MCLGRLAAAAVEAGDIDHSLVATRKAIGLIRTAGMSSARTVQQLKIVHDGLVPHHRAHGVGDLLEEIRAIGA